MVSVAERNEAISNFLSEIDNAIDKQQANPVTNFQRFNFGENSYYTVDNNTSQRVASEPAFLSAKDIPYWKPGIVDAFYGWYQQPDEIWSRIEKWTGVENKNNNNRRDFLRDIKKYAQNDNRQPLLNQWIDSGYQVIPEGLDTDFAINALDYAFREMGRRQQSKSRGFLGSFFDFVTDPVNIAIAAATAGASIYVQGAVEGAASIGAQLARSAATSLATGGVNAGIRPTREEINDMVPEAAVDNVYRDEIIGSAVNQYVTNVQDNDVQPESEVTDGAGVAERIDDAPVEPPAQTFDEQGQVGRTTFPLTENNNEITVDSSSAPSDASNSVSSDDVVVDNNQSVNTENTDNVGASSNVAPIENTVTNNSEEASNEELSDSELAAYFAEVANTSENREDNLAVDSSNNTEERLPEDSSNTAPIVEGNVAEVQVGTENSGQGAEGQDGTNGDGDGDGDGDGQESKDDNQEDNQRLEQQSTLSERERVTPPKRLEFFATKPVDIIPLDKPAELGQLDIRSFLSQVNLPETNRQLIGRNTSLPVQLRFPTDFQGLQLLNRRKKRILGS